MQRAYRVVIAGVGRRCRASLFVQKRKYREMRRAQRVLPVFDMLIFIYRTIPLMMTGLIAEFNGMHDVIFSAASGGSYSPVGEMVNILSGAAEIVEGTSLRGLPIA